MTVDTGSKYFNIAHV